MSRDDVCDLFCYDEDKVSRVKKKISSHPFQDMAHMFKMLSDQTRLKVACALCEEDELCVCDVAHVIGSTLATASHHLRLLRSMGIAKYRKEGKLVFYSLKDERLKQMIRLAAGHRGEAAGYGQSG